MNYILFDDPYTDRLKPFTFVRPAAEIRTGYFTIREKWELLLKARCSYLTQPYLSKKFSTLHSTDNILINGRVISDPDLAKEVMDLQPEQKLVSGDLLIACRFNQDQLTQAEKSSCEDVAAAFKSKECHSILKIDYPWDIFRQAGACIGSDFHLLTSGRTSAKVSDTNTIIAPENVFFEEGARAECAIINGSFGPVYIGRDCELGEGSMIRGPLVLCEGAALKMGAKVYGPTVLGPHSKAGGELNNVVIFGYSNKGHDGFLGNAVIGEWCNLGADTNCSNLKNNYSTIKVYDYSTGEKTESGLQFCGLIMGDHSKCGINTMFNTGTVTGVFCNIFDSGFPPVHIPSFSWGGAGGFTGYRVDKAIETTEKMMERRNVNLSREDREIIGFLFGETETDRKF